MLTQFISNPSATSVCVHNTSTWQVAELMGGLGCEILLKERICSPYEQKERGLPLHECFSSAFFQGEAAAAILDEFRTAQKTCTPQEIDRLMLEEYRQTLDN